MVTLFDSAIKECGLVHVKLWWVDFQCVCVIRLYVTMLSSSKRLPASALSFHSHKGLLRQLSV